MVAWLHKQQEHPGLLQKQTEQKKKDKAGVAQGTIATPPTFKISVDPAIKLLQKSQVSP
jgi:hypothetical protein